MLIPGSKYTFQLPNFWNEIQNALLWHMTCLYPVREREKFIGPGGWLWGILKPSKKSLPAPFCQENTSPFFIFFRQKSLDPFFSLGKSWSSLSSHVPINFACSLRFHFRAFFSSLGLIMPLSWHKLVEYAHPRFQYINFSKDSKCASNGMRHCYILEKSVFGPLRPISAYFGLFWA